MVWVPQPGPQLAAIRTAPCIDELLFGGARGGGKSDFLLGDFGQDVGQGLGSAWRGILFRRSYPELEELIIRSREIYPSWFPGATYAETAKTWTFPDGATLRLRFIERDSDADLYQGHQYTWIGWDELGNWPNLGPYRKMKATLRSAAGVEAKRIRASANPGGPGHLEVKQYFGIDRYPMGVELITGDDGMTRMFIRSRVEDNRILMENDPQYINRLRGVGSTELVRAWLEGDWDAIVGAYFDCWRADKHVVEPFEIPEWWGRFRSFDWGSAKPFSVGWWAVAGEDFRGIPRGSLVRYREWYGRSEPNVGLKLTVEQVASGILDRSRGEEYAYTVADTSVFDTDGGPSKAERFFKAGVKGMKRADKKRIPGWDQLRTRLIGDGTGSEPGTPMIYFFSTCTDTIRTLPALQHDEIKPEDLDSDGEDHCFVAGTMVDTEIGPVPIERLHSVGVWSAGKWRRGYFSRLTRYNARVVRLKFSDGRAVVCTPDHKFMDCSGEWRYAKDLQGMEVSCDQSLSARQFRSFWASGITDAVSTFSERARGFIGLFGNTATAKSQAARTYTIRMVIGPTMRPTIWSALLPRITWRYTARNQAFADVAPLTRLEMPPQSGMVVTPAEDGTASITSVISAPSWLGGCLRYARNAVGLISLALRRLSRANIAEITVRPVRCVSVEDWGAANVYCLDEPETHAFTIEGGLIVHNCADEIRYACMSRAITKGKPAEPEDITKLPTLGEMTKDFDERRSSERKRI